MPDGEMDVYGEPLFSFYSFLAFAGDLLLRNKRDFEEVGEFCRLTKSLKSLMMLKDALHPHSREPNHRERYFGGIQITVRRPEGRENPAAGWSSGSDFHAFAGCSERVAIYERCLFYCL
jgi:hypothetical protein